MRLSLTLIFCALFVSGYYPRVSLSQGEIELSTFSIAQIVATVNQAEFPIPGIRQSLLSKLNTAQSAYDRGNTKGAISALEAFQHHVEAQSGKHISPHDAATLRSRSAATIKALLRGLKLGLVAVGAAGATLSVSDPDSPLFGLTIELPAGAVSETTTIGVEVSGIPESAALLPDHQPVGPWVRLTSSEVFFNQPILVRFPLSLASLPPEAISEPEFLRAVSIDSFSGRPQPLLTVVDRQAGIVEFETGHFSFFGLSFSRRCWSLASERWQINTLRYFIKSTKANSLFTGREDIIRQGFQAWERTCRLRFEEVADEDDAQIVVRDFLPIFVRGIQAVGNYIDQVVFERQFVILGHTQFPFFGLSLETELEDNDTIVIGINSDVILGATSRPVNDVFLHTITHEIGHAIGIAHSACEGAIMSTSVSQVFTALQPDDVAALESKYGRPTCTGSLAYITNIGSDTVSVIDTSTHTVRATITVPSFPFAVDVSPSRGRVYVAHNGSSVSVIDSSTNSLITNIPVEQGAQGVAATPDGSRVYVTATFGQHVSVIDASTFAISARIPIQQSQAIAITPNGTRAYVTSFAGPLSVINTSTNTVIASIPGVGGYPAIAPNGMRAYIGGALGVSVINTATNDIEAVIPGVGYTSGVVNPAGTRLYVVNQSTDTLTVINTGNNAVIASISTGGIPQGVSVTPDGSRVYVANFGSDNVSVIDTSTNRVITNVPVGSGPIAFGNFISR